MAHEDIRRHMFTIIQQNINRLYIIIIKHIQQLSPVFVRKQNEC